MNDTAASWRKSSYSHANGNCVEVTGWRKSRRSMANGNCVEAGTWRKSRRSQSNSHCVEVGGSPVILVRDTTDRDGPRLEFTVAAWSRFLAEVKDAA